MQLLMSAVGKPFSCHFALSLFWPLQIKAFLANKRPILIFAELGQYMCALNITGMNNVSGINKAADQLIIVIVPERQSMG